MTTFHEYKSRVIKTNDYPQVIKEARAEHGVILSDALPVFSGNEIPLNLEREYFDLLIDENRLEEGKRIIDRMKYSYTTADFLNLIEQYEYRLLMVVKTEELIHKKLQEAKRDFNQHTILIISVVVGVITIFGSANQIFRASDIREAILTFCTISGILILFVISAFVASKYSK